MSHWNECDDKFDDKCVIYFHDKRHFFGLLVVAWIRFFLRFKSVMRLWDECAEMDRQSVIENIRTSCFNFGAVAFDAFRWTKTRRCFCTFRWTRRWSTGRCVTFRIVGAWRIVRIDCGRRACGQCNMILTIARIVTWITKWHRPNLRCTLNAKTETSKWEWVES